MTKSELNVTCLCGDPITEEHQIKIDKEFKESKFGTTYRYTANPDVEKILKDFEKREKLRVLFFKVSSAALVITVIFSIWYF